ncbi:MAG: protein-L-isoaspartate(D-aspartate) O-methyltransferase [Actinobacteria bacterium]|nr:protein-L-isoaspartate(D-aspartate) O-methyltransferase [Actinomycetota bacterium]MBI3686546.1 protein-L-isoaspartate(D-aspartate) O-methyltransferase [Actinomycetota bacterium]
MSTVEQLRLAMVEQMIVAGSLRSRPWIDAFGQVPRSAFLRRFFRQSADLSGWEAVDERDPTGLAMIYSDVTLVTQLGNNPDLWDAARSSGGPVPGIPTSSSTAPGLMALMLEALDVRDGHRVLEIGTGTGYNAALLCHRLGSALVTTVEFDPVVAAAAGVALRANGYLPTAAVADGVAGYAEGAPYDRLIATCSTPAIPPEWVGQVRPGGVILTSLHRDLGGGPLVLVHVDEHGGAEGRFLPDYGGFMPVRSAGPVDGGERLAAALAVEEPEVSTRTTAIDPDVLDGADFGMVAALRLPGVASIGFEPVTGPQRWLLAGDGSWACLDEVTGAVSQHGTRRLWDEVEDAHRQWAQVGGPSRNRFGLTVTASGEHLFWLDTPQEVRWTEPA